jgi:hypothetical protein
VTSAAERVRALAVGVVDGEVVVWPAVIAGTAVACVSLAIGPNRGDVRVDVAMASMAAFLFGVLLAFTIVRTRERLALVQDLVAKDNSSLFSIHQMMAVFGAEQAGAIRDLVDAHLTDQMPSFQRLTDAVYALKPESPSKRRSTRNSSRCASAPPGTER